MSVPVALSPVASHDFTEAPDFSAFTPAVRRRSDQPSKLTERQRKAATIALSRQLEAVIFYQGVEISPENLGCLGLTVRQAWDLCASNLLFWATIPDDEKDPSDPEDHTLRFHLRPASAPYLDMSPSPLRVVKPKPSEHLKKDLTVTGGEEVLHSHSGWWEVGTDGAPSPSWLAHPLTFSCLHNFLNSQFDQEIYYVTTHNFSRLFICAPLNTSTGSKYSEEIKLAHNGPIPHPRALTYRLGFPVEALDVSPEKVLLPHS